MTKGEGKGWSKGRTAATDPRVARAAAAHVAPCLLRKRAIWDNYAARHSSWVREDPTTIYA